MLYWWRDPHEGTSFNSVVWTKDSRSGKPLLCVAGSVPKHITIIDIERGEPVRVLAGHGRNINELMVSPLAPNILASCSEDYTIRLWNLDPDYDRQPCVAMLFGEGHRQPMLASTFHPSGKWIISGGMDTAVALWPVPALHELNDPDAVDQEPRTVYYPHFHSTEVHHNYVDCIAFYGDLIISRCARNQDEKTKSNEILVWKIDGFDSSLPPPPAPPMPEPGVFTRSSFPHRPHTRGFQRLLTLSMPNTDRFYLRFGLLNTRPWRPILCMGSQVSKFCFWDLQKLEEGHDAAEEDSKGSKRKGGARKTKASVTEALLNRLGDLLEEARLGKVSSASDGSRDTGECIILPFPCKASSASASASLTERQQHRGRRRPPSPPRPRGGATSKIPPSPSRHTTPSSPTPRFRAGTLRPMRWIGVPTVTGWSAWAISGQWSFSTVTEWHSQRPWGSVAPKM